jgi:GDP-D-mannose 3',5'-epimerase
MQAAWFAVHVNPRQEEVVCKRFEYFGVATFLPQLLVGRRHGSRRWPGLKPLFPGYVFAHFVPEASLVYRLSWTSGAKRLLRDHEGPTPVPDDVIGYLKRRVEPLGTPWPTLDRKAGGNAMRILVTGAGGFIGHHLVKYLVTRGYWVRGVDIKHSEYEPSPAHEFLILDLLHQKNCIEATRGIDEVYHLAADMGGIGYITSFHAHIARNNVLMNLNMLEAARASGVRLFLFSSSACVYPRFLQDSPEVAPLREEVAWPADPEEGYGLEKLFTEKLCQYYREDYGLETRVVRLHNVYGPLGTYEGGKEKAPAAICRKVCLTPDGGEVEVWGDGEQTRSFMYIDDCVEGIYRIMRSDYPWPLNLGTEELVTINQLVDLVIEIAGKTLRKRHDVSKPQGVRGRNSDNSRVREVLGWEPMTRLRHGLVPTYKWIEAQLTAKGQLAGGRVT